MIFIWPIRYLTRHLLQTCYADENHHFLKYSAKNPAKIPCFYDFSFSKKLIFANFHVYFQCIPISEGALTLRRHSDVIWSSMLLILVSVDRGGPYLYTGSKYKSISGVPYRKSREGVAIYPAVQSCPRVKTCCN